MEIEPGWGNRDAFIVSFGLLWPMTEDVSARLTWVLSLFRNLLKMIMGLAVFQEKKEKNKGCDFPEVM